MYLARTITRASVSSYIATVLRRFLCSTSIIPPPPTGVVRRLFNATVSQYTVNMIVQVEEGKLQGVEKKSTLTGKPFYAFLGIPFAKPPVGDLRFKAPVPIGKWDGVLDASKEGGECIQRDMLSMKPEVVGTENCLYLNVYTPEPPSSIKTKKAVMVYIHGGGFFSGSGSANVYGPDYLIGHDVIYVTMNYRLHIFGFLNTGTPSCPGNAGLKDQLLAMKWVKKNVARFGGDPENITLFGESAGAASVHLHMLSPLSKGLFNRTIVQSGSFYSPWAIEKDPESQARKIGRLAGYEGQDLEGLVEYLKNQPAVKLLELAGKCNEDLKRDSPGRCATVTFIPSVEKIKDGALLPDAPEKLMESAPRLPSIFGYNDQEGILAFLAQIPQFLGLLLDDFSLPVKNNFRLGETQQAELLAKIKEFYFGNKTITPQCVPQIVDLYTDLYFMKFYEAIDYLVRSDVPPYIYLFAHDGKYNLLKNIVKRFIDLNIKGAAHGDELGYLFTMQMMSDVEPDEADKEVINHFSTLWTNFAKTGHPTFSLPHVDWKPHTDSHPCHIKIEKTLQVVNEKMFEERLNFWKNWSAKFR